MKFGTTKILWINSNILISFEYYQLFFNNATRVACYLEFNEQYFKSIQIK